MIKSDLVDLLRAIAPDGPWLVRTIAALEEKSAQKIPNGMGYIEPTKTDSLQKWVEAAAAGKQNCYLHAAIAERAAANKSKLSKTDVASSRCTWTDLDPNPEKYEESRAAILAAMQAEHPPFSCIVDSGNGYQGYKFIEPATDIAALEAANRAINESLNGRLKEVGIKADSCWSVDHLMRAPGTTNFMTAKKRQKGYPEGDRQARIIEWHPERIYKLTELAKAEAPKREAPRSEPPTDNSPPITALNDPRLGSVSAEVMAIICTGERPDNAAEMKWGHIHFKVVAELLRAGLSAANVKQVYNLSPLGVFVESSSRRFDGYLNRLIKAVRELADQKLFEMNARHCVLPIGGKTRVATWDDDPDFPGHNTIIMFSPFSDFKALYNKYRHTYETKDEDGNPQTVTEPLGTWWLSHPHRRQYDGGMRFMPLKDEEVIGDVLNLWRGFGVEAKKPEGKSGEAGCKLFLDHGLKIICSGNADHYAYLIKREAFIAQRRTRSEIGVGLQTEIEGTGKGLWSRTLNHLYGEHAMEVQNPAHVTGKHNRHLEKLLRLTADEALFALDPRHRNALYNLITEPRIPIEPKFIDAYPADNHINIDVISNSKHFLPVSASARRLFLPTVSPDKANDHEYFRKIMVQLEDERGYEALLHHLLHEVDLTDFNVRAVTKTDALTEQAAYSRKGVDLLVEHACSEACVPCAYEAQWPDFSICTEYDNHKGFDYFIDHNADQELKRMGSLTVKRRLKEEWGCTTGKDARKQITADVTLYVGPGNVIRLHGIAWPPLAQLREKFEQKHGKQQWLYPGAEQWHGLPQADDGETM